MKKQTGSVAGYRLSVFGHRWGLSTGLRPLFTVYCSLLTVFLLAGTAPAAWVNEWKTDGVSTNMSAVANWSLGTVPTSNNVVRWNSPSYANQPSMDAAQTFGQLLFDTNNTTGVTIGGSSALTLNRLDDGVGIQMTNGAVTINAPITLGNSLSFINNNPSGGNALTVTNSMSGLKRLTVSGSGDTIVGDLLLGTTAGLTMNGTGTLTLNGSANNTQGNAAGGEGSTIVNSGTVKFNKGGTAKAVSGDTKALTIGGANATPATVQYTGASTNMIPSGAIVYILGGGRLDINGGTQYSLGVGGFNIYSMGAAGDTTPLMNSGSGGTLYLYTTYVLPRPGNTTTLDSGSGSGTLSMNGGTLYSLIAGGYGGLSRDGTVRVNGKINLVSAPGFTAYNGDAADDLTINAAISGALGVGFTVTSTGVTGNNGSPGARVVLTNDNSGFSGPVTASGVILNIRHGNALGTPNAAYVTTVSGGAATLELQHPTGIAVGAQPLSLGGPGIGTVGGLRNVSGDNSWNGPITLASANPAARINSDSGTLTLSNNATIGGIGALYVGGKGNVNILGNIDIVVPIPGGGPSLVKDGDGKLTLSTANLKTGATTVNGGTLALDLSSGSTSKTWSGPQTLTLNKGSLELRGGSQTELFSSTSLGAGSFAVTSTNLGSKLRLNAITRAIGTTIDFSANNLADTDTDNGRSPNRGIIGPLNFWGYATVASNTWAINSTDASDGPITGLPLGSYQTNELYFRDAQYSNYDMSASIDTTVTNNSNINNIRFNNAAARTLTISNGVTLNVPGGGILVTPNVGAYDNVITNGTVDGTTGNQVPLTIHQHNTAGKLSIYSVLTGTRGLVKAGPGTVVLGGASNNTFTGGSVLFFVNGGTLELAKSDPARALVGPSLTINQTGIVKYNGTSTDMITNTCLITINENGQLDFNGATDTIGNVTIASTGASGNTTPIKNTAGGGTLTIGTLGITPVSMYTTTVNSASGTLALGGDVTFGRAGYGVVQLSGKVNMGAAARGFYPANGDADTDVIVDAVLSGTVAAGSTALTVRGSINSDNNGRLVLSGNNTFTGNTTIGLAASSYNVVLNLQHSNALGATGTGNGVVFTGNGASTLELQGGISVGDEPLSLTGAGYMNYGVLRNVSGNNSWGGAITLTAASRINSDSGTLTLSSGSAISGATFGLTVGGAGDVTISDAIATTTGTLTKDGAGMLTLSGTNTFTGATAVNDGTLLLDYSTQNNSKLSDTTALSLSKGTLTLSGGSHTETNLSTTLNPGSFVVNRPSGSSVLRMNVITRANGSTINFDTDGIADTDTANANNYGILGGYATVGSNTWAVSTNSGGAGTNDCPITGLPTGSYLANAGFMPNFAASNLDMSAGIDTIATNNYSINSIRFNNAAARTLTISNSLTVTSGGILNTAAVLGNNNVITGGTLSAYIVHQYNTAGTLRIDSIVSGANFIKTGPGTLILGGSSANSITTAAYVNGGELDLDKSAGTAAAIPVALTINQTGIVKYINAYGDQIGTVAVTINENGQLDFNGATDTIGAVTIASTGASGNTTPIKNTAGGGNLTITTLNITPLSLYTTRVDTASGTLTLSNNVIFNAAGSGVAQISGNLNLGSASRDFSVADGETANDMVIDAVISGAAGAGITKAGTGRLVLGGANTSFSGPVTINAGILTITNASALGTSGGSLAVNGTTVNSGYTLELLGGITVGVEALSLNNAGINSAGALRNVSGNNTWGGPISLVTTAVRINSDKDTLTLSGDVTSVGAFGLTIGGAGDTTISGALDVSSLGKDGTGTLTLSGATKRTGAVSVSGGKLVLDYTGVNMDIPKITDAAGPALTLTKSTLDLTGSGSATQSVGSVTICPSSAGQPGGHSAITRSSGTSVLRMGQITFNAGASLDIAANGIADTDIANENGILNCFATVGGSSWAYNSTGAADGPINALPDGSYVANGAGTTNSLSPNNTDNVDMTSGDTILTNNDTVLTLRFNAPDVGRTLSLSTNTLNLGGGSAVPGGILVTANVGSHDTTITNGTLVLPTNGRWAVHQYNANGALVIYSWINSAGATLLTKTGPGRLVIGGSSTNIYPSTTYVNGGTLELNKPGAATALGGTGNALYINQTGIVKYTGNSTNMIPDACNITINENGQLDFNGQSDTVGALNIASTGASGPTTPIKNTVGGGNVTWGGAWSITPLTGFETLIDSGTGTNTLTGNVTFNTAGSGTARISGNLALISNVTFTVADGEALDDLVIDAVISGSGSITQDLKGIVGRLVLGGANTFTNTVTLFQNVPLDGGCLTITNGSALGTADGGTVVQAGGTGTTLEMRGGITVAAEPLTLSGMGQKVAGLAGYTTGAGALRSYSGNNTWGGPVTLAAYSRISSDAGSLLTLTNTVNGAGFGLNVAGLGDVTINGAISSVSALTNDCLGTLTLGGAVANAITSTVVNSGTVLLNKTSGAAVSNLTVNGGPNPLNGTYGLVRYAANSANPQISGTVTLKANMQGAGQLDFNGATDTLANVIINSTGAYADSRPIVNTGNGGQLTINALNITPVAEYITKLDSGTNGVLRLGGDVTFTTNTTGQATISGVLDLNGATRTFNCVGLGAGPIYDLGISAVITNGSLTKTGTGRLSLSGVNTYAGDTLVNAGTLVLENANALVTNATLSLVSSNGVCAIVNLNFSGTQTVAALRFDGVLQSGTWGSGSSPAANKSGWFSGPGVLNVTGKDIVNLPVSGVTGSAANFNGQLISAGLSATQVGVLWGTTDGGLSGAWAYTNWFDGTSPGGTSFSTNISPLNPSSTYYYTYVASNAEGVLRAAPSVSFYSTNAGTALYWKGVNTEWTNTNNWTNSVGQVPAQSPTALDDVFINGGANHPTLNLLSGPVTIKSLTLGTSLASTQTVANGDVDTRLLRVEGDVTIGALGVLTHGTNTVGETQRLRLDVGGNLTIAAGGQINVAYKGYAGGNGPGAGLTAVYSGGGYGGEGGLYSLAPVTVNSPRGTTYGSVTNPVNNGSGPTTGANNGGGTAVLRVGGTVTNNGIITANGNAYAISGVAGGGGSGGSINITAGAITGATGRITASGGAAAGNNNQGGGGGGRIALVVTNAGATLPASVLTNTFACGNPGDGLAIAYGAAGTIYLRTPANTYGDLIVNNTNTVETAAYTLLHDSTYRFDSITVTNQGQLAAGANAVLTLDGCVLRSDSTTNGIKSRLIVKDNAQLNWTGTYTNNGCISWRGTSLSSGLSVGSLTIASGGILTHETTERPTNCLTLAVNGDLTVDLGGAIWVRTRGYATATRPSFLTVFGAHPGGAHGGEGGGGGNGLISPPTTPTYGSLTNPVTAGSGGDLHPGGGVAIIRAANVIVNGVIDAAGEGIEVIGGTGGGGGAGGSVNIRAGAVSGNGSISAKGGDTGANNSGCGGGGGRIAVLLTNSATFGNVVMTAAGGLKNNGVGGGNGTIGGAAGTIYLKGTDSAAYGLLVVSNNVPLADVSVNGTNATTLISTQVTDAVVGDVQLLGTGTFFKVASTATLTVNGSWSNAVATNAMSGGTVELAMPGAGLTNFVWGGNTWSNLVITNVGTVVAFETNKIQYVFGAPIWSNNVVLTAINPTSTNTMWKLQKGSSGTTQDVGVVRVGHSDASSGMTFKGAVGSTRLVKNSTQNWVLPEPPPAGTVFLFR